MPEAQTKPVGTPVETISKPIEGDNLESLQTSADAQTLSIEQKLDEGAPVTLDDFERAATGSQPVTTAKPAPVEAKKDETTNKQEGTKSADDKSKQTTDKEAAKPDTKADKQDSSKSDGVANNKSPFDDINPFKAHQEQQAPAKEQQKQGRNYEGLTEQEADWFKKMGNEAYNAMRPVYEEYKKLKAAPQAQTQAQTQAQSLASVFEHEEGYMLTPQFKTLISETQRANQEHVHWQEQLAAIRAGQKWKELYADEQGNLVAVVSDPV